MRLKSISICFLLIMCCIVSAAWAGDFIIDPTYSTIHHRTRHLMGYAVGTFDKFEGELRFDRDNEELKRIDITIDTTSVNTNNEMRDAHLRGEDFFYTEKYPEARFRGKLNRDGKIEGQLDLRGEKQDVVLDYSFWGVGTDQFGREKVGMTLNGTINRKDFGMTYNQEVEGGWLLGDTVEITIEIQGLDEESIKK